MSKFRKFSSGESGPARYVRLACDILGTREDEKNGCRMDWEGYCSKIDKKSSVTSFRMNRFNNFFEGAAALCYHRNDIIDFLTNFKQSLNLKVDSIFHDAQSSKSIQNQNTLLLKAREQGISLRKKHAEQEKHVIEKVTATLEATHRQKMEKEANHIELKRAIIESVQLYEGPCKSAADVDQLLNRLSGESETKKFLNKKLNT